MNVHITMKILDLDQLKIAIEDIILPEPTNPTLQKTHLKHQAASNICCI